MNQRPRQQSIYRQFFVYDIGAQTLAGDANGTYPITIETDADFEVVNLTYYSTSTLTIQIKQGDRTWFFRALDSRLIAGTAQEPYILPVPRVIKRNTTLQFTITDTSGSSNTFNIALLGNKLYRRS